MKTVSLSLSGDDDDASPPDEIIQALAKNKGRYSEAARSLGISRSTLWRCMKSLGLHPKSL